MRLMVVAALVALISIAGIAFPEVGMLGYIWFGQMRPDIMAYSDYNRFSMFLAIAVLIGGARKLSGLRWIFTNPFTILFLLLQFPILVSVLMTRLPSAVWPKYIPFLQMSLMALLIPVIIDTKERFKWLILTLAFSLGGVGFKFGAWGMFHGGVQFSQGVGGMHSDNNTMALGLVVGLPFCWYAVSLVKPYWAKWLFAIFTFTTVAAILMTHSRAGILSMGLQFAYFFWRSRRKLGILVLLVLMAAPAFLLTLDSLVRRMSTLGSPIDESSAAQRVAVLRACLQMLPKYWLVGVGFGADAFSRVLPEYLPNSGETQQRLVAHNNWLQMWLDSGILALLIYSALILSAVFWLGRAGKRQRQTAPLDSNVSFAMQCSLIGFCLGSTFASRTNYDLIYIVLASVGTWYNLQKAQAAVLPLPAAAVAVAPPPAPPLAMPVAQPRPVGLGRALRSAGRALDRPAR
ncbi:MAG: O-antigen ligase family protein [Acidobacteria bacterium]|nr:O-antigen ligase family protein [Acidobacteriota bacterium]